MKKLLFVINPHSGMGIIKNKILEIIDIFTSNDYEVTIYTTKCHNDAYEKICRDGTRFDLVVCSGGDGTLNEAVSALMQLPAPPCLGYIPSGTVNDFASNLKIPKNMLAAAKNIMEGSVFQCDVGAFNEQYFTYIAAFGAYTEISYETSQDIKNIIGRGAYFIETLKHLGPLKSYKIKITLPDGRVIRDSFAYGMVTNSNTIAGFRGFKPKPIDLNDGIFDAIFIKNPTNPIAFQSIANDFLMGIKQSTDYIYCFETSQVTIESEEPLSWTLDGEFGGYHTKADIKNLHSALKIKTVYTPS